METVYLNHAGTSWPKPPPVREAAAAALEADARGWGASFEAGHARVADFLGVTDPRRLLLTPGCTSALALAIQDQPWSSRDAVAISGFEHVAVERPVAALRRQGVTVHVLPSTDRAPVDLEGAERILRGNRVRLLAVSAAANTTGDLLPIAELVGLAHAHDTTVLVDAAQVVGWLDAPLSSGADLVAFGGHKGLQGIWGIGGLIVRDGLALRTPRLDGDLERPGYCDGGSVDRAALSALSQATDWLRAPERRDRLHRARRLAAELESRLQGRADLQLIARRPIEDRMPTVAIAVAPGDLARYAASLETRGIIVGRGLQCAPLAHRTLGTAPEGTLRISFGPTSRPSDVDAVWDAL